MKKTAVILLCLAMVIGIFAGCGNAQIPAAEKYKIALIAMDRIDQHWTDLEAGAMKAAQELDVEVVTMSPDTRDDAQQAEQVQNAVSSGCHAIVIAVNNPDTISPALQDAVDAGVKIIYVDSPAAIEAEATYSTDNKAAGFAVAEAMIAELEACGITDGAVGIINVNAATTSTLQREAGFREAFEGKDYTLLETQYAEGDAAKSRAVSEAYIVQGVVAIFGCSEGSTGGAGDAVKAAGSNVMVAGFGNSDAIQDLIAEGHIWATMVQNSDVMGYEGVKAAVAALKGESLGGAVADTGASLLKTEVSVDRIPVAASNDYKIALITMDRVDKHWAALEVGAMKAASELGCEVVNLSPNVKDDTLQIEKIQEAVSSGCDAIVIAANSADAVSPALEEAMGAGVKIICVDTPAGVAAGAVVSTDNKAAGFNAGETMLAALEARGITEGNIGIIGINATADSAAQREAGFREALAGKGYTLLETRYSEGDAAKSQTIAQTCIEQGVVGIFACSEGSTNGTGNAVQAAQADIVVVGFGANTAIRELINSGHIFAAMVQNPDVMGYKGIQAACAVLHGKKLGASVMDAGVSVLTK